ncbi:MAG: hypothetical protein H6595_12950 [Flavobacteriales bacterium]|nr:hypothetical protein [Flavobacteriales bacterium]MCB9168372.1 hypothetical protein [Flavobacteriales bacterium]
MHASHLLLSSILLTALTAGCGHAQEGVDAADTTTMAALPVDSCSDLDGRTFRLTYYLDNKEQGTETLTIRDGHATCGGCGSEGMTVSEVACYEEHVGKLGFKVNMSDGATAYRMWKGTIENGVADGTMEAGHSDFEAHLYTFSGPAIK